MGVAGEAYFFSTKDSDKNNNALGDMLGREYYYEPATIPGRNGEIRRVATSIDEYQDVKPWYCACVAGQLPRTRLIPPTQIRFEPPNLVGR